MINDPWEFKDKQTIDIGDKEYNTHAAISLAADLPVINLSLDTMYINYTAPCRDSFRDFIAHMKLVIKADLKYPIILNQDGSIIDGKHRLAKAFLEGKKTIKAKRFAVDPEAIFTYK